MELTNAILATGALGTAAFGVVEALKFTPLGNAGFGVAMRQLGSLVEALHVAYGDEYRDLLRGQYRAEDRELLARTLRQGVRVGTTDANAGSITRFLGSIDQTKLAAAIHAAETGADLSSEQRNVIGRFELAADARIDAALTLARARYVDSARVAASVVALTLALIVGANMPDVTMVQAFIVGLAAVPLAPIAKDVASGIQAAAKALRK
ncbi:MAG: hypothetical protein AABZ80_12240 [Gemmatimonadota bacterium]